MMKRILAAVVVTALAFLLILPSSASAKELLKVDKYKPVPATNVELARKVHIDHQAQSAKPPKVEQAATGILGPLIPVNGTKYAIVIGISDYPGTGSDLKYGDDDARDVVSALMNTYSFADKNITKLIDEEGTEARGGALVASRANIIQAIIDIGQKASSNDEVVFFFSGHGGKGQANDGDNEKTDECIWAHNGSTSFVPIWDGELNAVFSGYKTSRIVFIFDSCYAGGMTDLAAPSRVIIMATTETTLATELATWQNGELTYYLVDRGMLAGLADSYDNLPKVADITIEEAWDYANTNCRMDKPTISDSFDNDLLL